MHQGVLDVLTPDVATLRQADRLCLFAHFHPLDVVADYVLLYLSDLRQAGFKTVVISTSRLSTAEQRKLIGYCDGVICRDNYGLDIAGWVEACVGLFPISADLLLLCNDSVYGPLWPVGIFVDELCRHPADFYGAVTSLDLGEHLQSWFRIFRPSAYNSAAFGRLMLRLVPRSISKWELILNYEVGLSRDLLGSGLTYHSAYAAPTNRSLARRYPFNPTSSLWKQLVTIDRIPFLKIEVMRDNRFAGRSLRHWRRLVRRTRPELVRMIEEDIDARGSRWPSRWLFRYYTKQDSMYHPELRKLIEWDHRQRGRASWLTKPVYAALLYAGRIPRVIGRRVGLLKTSSYSVPST